MDTVKTIGLLLLLLASFNLEAASKIYKTVDKDGNVSFTDVPPANEPASVELSEMNAYSDQDAVENRRTRSVPAPISLAEEPEEETFRYASIAVRTPEHEAAIRDNAGNMTISVALSPGLNSAEDHQLQILLDGKPAESGNATNVELTNVDRGSHTVVAQVINGAGDVILASEPVVFHMLRYSSISHGGS